MQDVAKFLSFRDLMSTKVFARLISAPEQDEQMFAPGSEIGAWRLRRLLGRGGSSIVFLADRFDSEFQQEVALKIVRPDTSLANYFRRERQILADLHHHGIARFIDGGETRDGRLWFAMEAIDGQRIDEYVRSQRLGWRERLELLDAVCKAVAYAHGRLLVHRDIKPSNILIDEHRMPRLLDFGIALAPSGSEEPAGDGRMSLGYASPEQMRAGQVGTASDIYQLGLLLRLMIFDHDRLCPTLTSRPRRRIAGEIHAVADKAMAARPEDRYPAVAMMQADLAAILDRRPLSMAPGLAPALARFAERNAWSCLLAGAAVAVLTTMGLMAATKLRYERDHAVTSAAHSEAIHGLVMDLVGLTGGGNDDRSELKKAVNAALGEGGERAVRSGNPRVDASMAIEIAKIYEGLGELPEARETLMKAIARANEDLDIGDPYRVELERFLGFIFYRMGNYELTGQQLDRVRVLAAAVSDERERSVQIGKLAALEGLLARRRGRYEDASLLLQKSIGLLTRSLGADHPATARSINNLGLVRRDLGDYHGAVRLLEQALWIYNDKLGSNSVLALQTASNVAYVMIDIDELSRAEQLIVPIAARIGDTREGIEALMVLSNLRASQGRYLDSLQAATRLHESYVKFFGADHVFRAYALSLIGNARVKLGDEKEAFAAHEEALALRRKIYGDIHPDVAQSLKNIGKAHLHFGNHVAGIAALRTSMDIYVGAMPADHVMVVRARFTLAEALESTNPDEARQLTEQGAQELARHSVVLPSDKEWLKKLKEKLGPRSPG